MPMTHAGIEILVEEPTALIDPNIHGHFMEHLGSCVDSGCWVGEDSAIPNTGGIRNDVVEALKAVRPPVIRWPGGCFADDYHWQEGVGPRADRPRRVNIHWGNVVETNQFGTHEFLAFCRAVGAQPYLCGNVGSGSPREMRDWVEYCNYPGESTLARQRAANGSPEPFAVRYWGVGNENWGCGGHFTPEDYATEYSRFATYLRDYGTPLTLIACGPNGNDLDWTRRFLEKARGKYGRSPLHAMGAHYYCGTAGSATEYTTEQWYELLWKASRVETLITQQREAMDAFDPTRKIGLIIDEWGTWHPPTPGRNPAFLWQQNTIRDALVTALSLDIFQRHADKIVMANIAQTINVLQALLLTEEDRMVRTPTYYAYLLYAAHQGGQSLRVVFDGPELTCHDGEKTGTIPALSGSASLKDRIVTVTVVNTNTSESIPAEVRLRGHGGGDEVQIATLAARDGGIHAHNTFEDPDAVSVSTQTHSMAKPAFEHLFPPASVTRLVIIS